MSDISLTASMRSNLLSLQNTQSLMDQTQDRLSTGKKVNSAIDNPSSYYTAQSLTNRASDLESLLDSMGQGIQTIQAANEGIEAITSFVEQAKAVANTARDTSYEIEPDEDAVRELVTTGTFNSGSIAEDTPADLKFSIGGKEVAVKVSKDEEIENVVSDLNAAAKTAGVDNVNFSVKNGQIAVSLEGSIEADVAVSATAGTGAAGATTIGLTFAGGNFDNGTNPTSSRSSSIKQYNEIMEQINQLAADASYKGVNLLKDGESLKIVFNEDRSSSITVEGKSADMTGLGLKTVSEADWSTNDGVDETITAIEGAVSKLRDMASEFGNNYSIVQTRQDFTENLINVLEEGADNLTLADMNEESANMLALQTRQQLAINSLSLASQAAQSVLSLF